MDENSLKDSFSALASRSYARPTNDHVSLGTGIRLILVIVPVLLVGLLVFSNPLNQNKAFYIGFALAAFLWKTVVSGIRIAAQWERGVVLRLGTLQAIKGPGLIFIIPVVDYVRFIDTRMVTLNIPSQKVITSDNVPASIDGAVFFKVEDAGRAVTEIQDYVFAISQYAQAALRDVVGGMSLDQVLSERDRIQESIRAIVDERAKNWGVEIDSVRLLDIEMPEDLKRMMSRQASAEREKRANITKSEGDKLAAENLAQAAEIMQRNSDAMRLRTLQTIDGLGPSASNTVLLFPVELMQIFQGLRGNNTPDSGTKI